MKKIIEKILGILIGRRPSKVFENDIGKWCDYEDKM